MTFNEFWAASGCVGKSGPAFAAWQKLTREDRRAIGDFAARNGGKIDTDGLWAGNWLQGRRWEAPRLQRPKSRAEEIEEAVARAAALMEKEWQPVRSERWVHGDDPEWPEVCRAYGHAPTLKDNRGGWTFVTK
jgi:hypothetical protein